MRVSNHLFGLLFSEFHTKLFTHLHLLPHEFYLSMGNPHWTEDKDKQCYNAAKSYQIAHQGAWYSKEYVKDLDPGKEPYWSGRLIGVAEYDMISDGDTVLLKIETGKSEDYFLAFNRKIGANADNKMASDRVTIIETGDNGVGFSQVSLDRRRYAFTFLYAPLYLNLLLLQYIAVVVSRLAR